VSGIDILPYAMFAAVAAACVVAIVLLGAQAWVVPVIALPAAVAYILYDRSLKRREERSGG
jgi:membrane protein implicated in regulation of membrane protease activity